MHIVKNIVAIYMLLICAVSVSQEQITLNVQHNTKAFMPNSQNTLVVKISNSLSLDKTITSNIILPENWRIITKSNLTHIPAKQSSFQYITFYIPSTTAPGEFTGNFTVKDSVNKQLAYLPLNFEVLKNRDIKVKLISASNNIKSGDVFYATYVLENNGNTNETVNLQSTTNTIVGANTVTLKPNTNTYVEVYEKTKTVEQFSTLLSDLKIVIEDQEISKAQHLCKIYPNKIKAKDPFKRFPVSASYIYNGFFSSVNDHFSVSAFEILGNGFVDEKNTKYLDVILRGPNHLKTNRFSSFDQYSLYYHNSNSQTQVWLGDYGLQVNRLVLNGRYGMGARIDQEFNKLKWSAFYAKPRFYRNNNAIYGTQLKYSINDSLKIGGSFVVTKPQSGMHAEIGKNASIFTLETKYNSKKTYIELETSASMFNNNVDFGNFFQVRQRFGKLRYSGNIIYTGENYVGAFYNSFSVSNSLSIPIGKKSQLQFLQSLFKVNQRLDQLFFTAEPHYQNYSLDYKYRINDKNNFNLRYVKRIREDKLEPKSFYYKEELLTYYYRYFNNKINFTLSGQVGKSKNLLLENSDYRKTFGTSISSGFRLSDVFCLNANINHTYTSKYSNLDQSVNYLRYGVGLNVNVSNDFRLNFNFNNSFNPEENYKTRDYIASNVFWRLSKNHIFELRTNYYSNPGVVDRKEFYTMGKYTYQFGVPIVKKYKEGGITGRITTSDSIDLSTILITASSTNVKPDEFGRFEINNLPTGKNYLVLDQATLPKNYTIACKMPFEVNVEEGKTKPIQIPLVKASNISGKIQAPIGVNNLSGYLQLESDKFTYYTKSNPDGSYNFNNIVPGAYKLTLVKLVQPSEDVILPSFQKLFVKPGFNLKTQIILNQREREVKFKPTNFNVKL